MFVVAHVRQALQHVAAIGACSPYFAAVCFSFPIQTVFTDTTYRHIVPIRLTLYGVAVTAENARHLVAT
jgi:hypothetical protein